MSFKSLTEIILHVESFRNIDLSQRGIYNVKFQLYEESTNGKNFAIPFSIIETKRQNQLLSQSFNIIEGPDIINGMSQFSSASFFIKFFDEVALLNDICSFRIETEGYPNYKSNLIYMEAELWFADIYEPIQISGKQPTFNKISSFKAKIRNINQGIHEYVPVIFDEDYFCVMNIMIHSVLLDFKFRALDPLIFDDKIISNKKMDVLPKNQPPKSLGEFLQINYNISKGEIQKFYEKYVGGLKKSYQKLIQYINHVIKRFQFEIKTNNQHQLDSDIFKVLNNYGTNQDSKEPSLIIQDDSMEYFSFRFNNINDVEKISNKLQNNLNEVASYIILQWQDLIQLLKSAPKFQFEELQFKYRSLLKSKWEENIIKSEIKLDDLTMLYLAKNTKIGEEHSKISEKFRKQAKLREQIELNVEDQSIFLAPEIQPVIFEEIYYNSQQHNKKIESMNVHINQNHVNPKKQKIKGVHIFVLVHGFQGSQWDLRLFKNNLSLVFPNALILCSSINENYTTMDIGLMGDRLAREVTDYINQSCPSENFAKLSFIGHSLGGLIVRAALPGLKQFQQQMFTYISLSSPHLGCGYDSSFMIEKGISVLQKWKSCECLKQLTMTDHQDLDETFLYKLAKYEGLSWFKNICLVSSFQDQYAPYESARVCFNPKALKKQLDAPLFHTMAVNILQDITSDYLLRVDINFKIKEKSLDTLIGRKAHILFLEDQIYMKMFISHFGHLFN